jgi:nicotinate-nucleotide adenylyltransferase
MNIGVAGGTFNPIHHGHLFAASEILKRFNLESIIFVPSARPPHKKTEKIIDPLHRYCMVVMATLHNPKFIVSPAELMRKESSYSIETIKNFKKSLGKKATFYFIIGVDAFLEIHTWKNPDLLLKNCHFIVTSRPGYEEKDILDTLRKNISSKFKTLDFKMTEKKKQYTKIEISRSRYFIFIAKIPALDISSTDIRKRVSQGKPFKHLVPEPVGAYIKKHGLYANNNSRSFIV